MTGRTWLTVTEVAELLRVSKMTVTRMIDAHDLPAIDVGQGGKYRQFRIPATALAEYMADRWVGEAPDGYRVEDLIGTPSASGGTVVALPERRPKS